jgi:hypothetical protein
MIANFMPLRFGRSIADFITSLLISNSPPYEGREAAASADRVVLLCVINLTLIYARSSSRLIGKLRIRFPVAAKIAFTTAGAIGGVPGSPTPPCFSVLGTM